MSPEFNPQTQSTLRLPNNPIVESYREKTNWFHLIEASVNFTPERKLIVESLMERPWFQRTSSEL